MPKGCLGQGHIAGRYLGARRPAQCSVGDAVQLSYASDMKLALQEDSSSKKPNISGDFFAMVAIVSYALAAQWIRGDKPAQIATISFLIASHTRPTTSSASGARLTPFTDPTPRRLFPYITTQALSIQATPSPVATMSSAHEIAEPHPAADNSLDDIFGSSPPRETRTEPSETVSETHPAAEPSDLPSLRRQHVTAGYRDGVSTSKGEYVQAGFDAGFPVGAQLGMRAGTILGILEGITRGLEDRSVSGVVKKPTARGAAGSSSAPPNDTRSVEMAESRRRTREQVLQLYQNAVRALDVQAVFTGCEAGTMGSAPGPEAEPRQKRKVQEKPEAQLARKGDSVVSTWEGRVAVPRWEKNMEALEMRERQGETDERS